MSIYGIGSRLARSRQPHFSIDTLWYFIYLVDHDSARTTPPPFPPRRPAVPGDGCCHSGPAGDGSASRLFRMRWRLLLLPETGPGGALDDQRHPHGGDELLRIGCGTGLPHVRRGSIGRPAGIDPRRVPVSTGGGSNTVCPRLVDGLFTSFKPFWPRRRYRPPIISFISPVSENLPVDLLKPPLVL